ncbi:MAG: electron transfer flavoprotein subunit beta/FixA family protein [Planctomycetes bacterium]|nr:electron transfer flavoprotein subunit beta/FixA family protein [Planctomycetota bacterium]MCB9890895.1 electron transfer flavoprotein subunit beta/FixA family protein [Planctomycetota bacterium]
MKIAVCVKRVPSTDTKVKPAADGLGLDPSGVEFEINPYDEIAIEAALQLAESAGDSEVVLFCVGAQDAQKDLRKALAMGGDRAVLIDDASPLTRDAHAASLALVEQLRAFGPDAVFLGKQAVDLDQSQTGMRIAEMLDMGCASEVVALTFDGRKAVAEREIEGGREIVDVELPAVFTTQKGLNEPRRASIKGVMAAKKKPLDVVTTALPDNGLEVLSFELPPERQAGRIVGEGAAACAELVKILKEEAKVL